MLRKINEFRLKKFTNFIAKSKKKIVRSSSYPMCSSHRVTSPRKTNPTKLNRSVSFSSDPVFKVPQTPPVRVSRSSSRPTNFEAIESSCPNCQFQRQDWRSQSLMDLQQRPRSSSLVRPSPSPRGCDSTSASSNNTASIFSNNLRSNSWRNLSLIGQTNEPGASLILFTPTKNQF